MGTPLGGFLRARRDATGPEAAGRRRARGLRRSEVAALAGISVEYLVRIEQGRDRNPSPAAINALADALQLDAAERKRLRHAAKCSSGSRGAAAPPPRLDVRPAVRSLLAQLEPGIAYVTNDLSRLRIRDGGERGYQVIGSLCEPLGKGTFVSSSETCQMRWASSVLRRRV